MVGGFFKSYCSDFKNDEPMIDRYISEYTAREK